MTAAAENPEGVHRLHDIVVEEVSLVDRAANLHRFLIVKRSDPMEDQKPDQAKTPDEEATAKQDDAAGSAPGADYMCDSSMLEAAVTALERLTETVETLGVLAEGDARLAIGEIATELRALADRLVEATGATPEPASAAEVPPADQLAMMMASVRTTLEQVGSLIDQSKRAPAELKTEPTAKDEGEADKSEKREPAAAAVTPAPAPAIDDPLRKDLAALTQAVTKLADGVKEQQQRLSKLEKGFGLPNSAATREQGGRPDAEDVGWPLDLNRPFDRESVDKAVSFHDL